MPVTNPVANIWFLSRWFISATRFGKQADMPYSRCRCPKSPCKEMKADLGRPWEERLIMKINRLDSLTASVYWAESENTLSICTTRPLACLGTGMGVPAPSGKKPQWTLAEYGYVMQYVYSTTPSSISNDSHLLNNVKEAQFVKYYFTFYDWELVDNLWKCIWQWRNPCMLH